MCGRTGMSWRRRSTPGSRTGSRGGDDRVCLRRGEGLRSFQGGRETWKTASWQPAGSRIRLPLKESDIPVAVNPKSADGPSNNPQCGFWDSQFSAAQVKSVEQPCIGNEQRSIPTAKICGGLEIIVSWHDYALALDGLDDERGDSARMQCLFERRKIIERNTNTIGNQGLEPASGYFVAIEGQRA